MNNHDMQGPAPQKRIDPDKLDSLLRQMQTVIGQLNQRVSRLERLTVPLHDPHHPLNQAKAPDDEG